MTERQLIREIRNIAAGMVCRCDGSIYTYCRRCHILDHIDKGLAEIAKTYDDPRYRSESTGMIGAKTAEEVRGEG